MSFLFEELDYAPTPIGAVSLRRRREPKLGRDVLEVLLREEHLMSDAFTASEVALADLALAALPDRPLEVVVGGLGLGYTARAALADPRVRRLGVVEYLQPVIGWHEGGLVPLGPALTADSRCRFVHADFFALALGEGFGRPLDALLIDIDHAPDRLLGPDAGFYAPEGLRAAARHLTPGGVLALWSDDAPDAAITARLTDAIGATEAHPVAFGNPYTGGTVTQTVYVARRGEGVTKP